MAVVFSGSRALVTGASSGIGEEFARAMAARGANLVITARSKDRLEALAADLTQRHHIDVAVVAGDLGRPGGAAKLCSDIDALDLPIDHLVNNAGFGSTGPLVDADAERQAEMVRLNCEAVVALTRHFLPAMVERAQGGVIQVASTAAYQPMPFMATYAASKAFVLSFAVAVAEELSGSAVRITALCPGPVPTGFQEVAGIEHGGVEQVAAVSAEETVRAALEGYERGRTIVVPGRVNRVQTAVTQLAPRTAVASLLAVAMRRMGRANS